MQTCHPSIQEVEQEDDFKARLDYIKSPWLGGGGYF